MSNQLAIVTSPKAKSIQPPLKKAEIFEALVQRQFNKEMEEYTRDTAAKKAAEERLQALALAAAKNYKPVIEEGTQPVIGRTWRGDKDGEVDEITVHIPNFELKRAEFTPEMLAQAKIIDRIRKSGSLNQPDLKAIRKDLREKMAGVNMNSSDRIKALLTEPSLVKALDKTLDELNRELPVIAA